MRAGLRAGMPMDDTLIATRARAAGLEIALRDFPDDVAAAAALAAGQAGGIAYPADPAAEPWPPMQAKCAP